MVTGPGIERNEGMIGFDWVTHRGDPQAANADMRFTGLLPPDLDNIRDRFDNVEGLSGWSKSDVLRGDDTDAAALAGDHELTRPELVSGLKELIGGATRFTGGNILIGGDGSDLIEGRGGNDLIDGDAWLNVQISVRDAANADNEIKRADSMKELQADVFAGEIKPSQLRVVREILTPAAGTHVDTAVFTEPRANYDITALSTTEMTITHARGSLVDGTDTLKHIERLQFADQTVAVGDLINQPATGTVDISDTTPTEGQLLTATRAFDDPEGVDESTIRFAWQTEEGQGGWTTVAVGSTFRPSDAEVGAALRVVATFNDNAGVIESVTSTPTAAVANVGAPPTATATLPAGVTVAPIPALRALLSSGAPARVTGLAVSRTGSGPLTVAANVPAGANVVRIRVFRLGRTARARAAADRGGRLVATVYRPATKAKRYRFRLTEPKLRRLQPARYRIEVRAGRSKAVLGPAVNRTLTVGAAQGRFGAVR